MGNITTYLFQSKHKYNSYFFLLQVVRKQIWGTRFRVRMGENGAESEFFDLCGARSGDGEICGLPRQDGRCGSWRAGRPPDLPARKKAEAGCLLLRMRPSGPYIAGQRPPTPQSPERLRSTPFDCVAIAPCCFAERKAVLSHAFAALTALVPVRGQSRRDMLRGADRA